MTVEAKVGEELRELTDVEKEVRSPSYMVEGKRTKPMKVRNKLMRRPK